MGNLPGEGQNIVVATAEHVEAISGIYRSVVIDPQILLDLVSPSSHRAAAAHQSIKTHGGFLSPPAEMDMQTALQHGLMMVSLQDDVVVGFNRYATDSEIVRQALFSEFQLDPFRDYPDSSSFQDWSGSRELSDDKTLTSIRWVDRQLALIAMQAVQAGLQNMPEGRLAWGIDAAVHPGHRHSGIARNLRYRMGREVRPAVTCLAYRVFEIRKVNNIDVAVDNDASKRAFVDTSSKLFAYTEEDIKIRSDIHVSVRWNQWIKRYQS